MDGSSWFCWILFSPSIGFACNSSSFIPFGGIAKEYNYVSLKSQLEDFTTLVTFGYTWIFVYLALLLCVVSSLENADSCLSSICTHYKAPMKA